MHKLLSTLKSSFRQHLDREHPRVTSENRRTVDQHIHSILENPLLSVKPRIPFRNRFPGHNHSISRLDHIMKRPMEYFKDEIAAGTATVESATMCIIAQSQKARVSPRLARRELLRSSRAGSIILNWLWSSPRAEERIFLLQRSNLKQLMQFLNAEGLEHLVWHWMKRFQRKIDEKTSAMELLRIRATQATILHDFLKAEVLEGAGLSSAVGVFLRGVKGIPTWSGMLNGDVAAMLERGGRFLMHEMETIRKGTFLNAESLDSLMQTADVWSSSPRLHQALLGLCHTQSANTNMALNFTLDFLKEVDHDYLNKLNPKHRNDMIRLRFKLTELLLSKGLYAKAAEVAWSIEVPSADIEHPSVASSSKADQLEQQRQQDFEDSNLKLLDTLAMH